MNQSNHSQYNKNEKKILFLFNTLSDYIGYRAPLIEKLIENGDRVFVLAPNDDKLAFDYIKKTSVSYFPLNFKRRRVGLFSFFSYVFKLYKVKKTVDPDIIHCFRTQLIINSVLLLVLYRKQKIIYTFTGLGSLFYKKSLIGKNVIKLISFYLKITLNSDNSIITFQNKGDRDMMIKLSAIREMNSCVLRGMDAVIDTNIFNLSPFVKKDVVNILFVGRLIKDKGILDLMDALRLLKKQNLVTKWTCTVIGKIEPGQNIITKELMHDCQKDGLIEWVTQVNFIDMVKYYQSSDIFCLPSYHEGLPRCLLECSFVGRPMVVFENHGASEILLADTNGFICPISDTRALSNALAKLINDDILREKMGRQANSIAQEKFDPALLLNEQLEIYARILK